MKCYPRTMNGFGTQLAAICRRFGVASLYVFGSRAAEIAARVAGDKPERRFPESDVDIAVQPVQEKLRTITERVGLTQALEDLFEIERVDLVLLPSADPFLAADAIRGELLYCDDEDRQAREELFILRRAGDLAPFQKARIKGILSGELRR